MKIFVDTSAILEALDRDADDHRRVVDAWSALLDEDHHFITTNYVAVETTAVAQSRLGMTAVRALEATVWPLMRLHWISEETHRAAVSALLAADSRSLSLVDCSSFEIMRTLGVRSALALDSDFTRQGYETLPH